MYIPVFSFLKNLLPTYFCLMMCTWWEAVIVSKQPYKRFVCHHTYQLISVTIEISLASEQLAPFHENEDFVSCIRKYKYYILNANVAYVST